MTEPALLQNLRARAAHAASLIRQFELSNSDLDGPASRKARTALLDLAEICMPDVVLALLDERAALISACEKGAAIVGSLIPYADSGFTITDKQVAAIEAAREWLAAPVSVARELIVPGRN